MSTKLETAKGFFNGLGYFDPRLQYIESLYEFSMQNPTVPPFVRC